MKIRFIVFYFMPQADLGGFPTEIFGPFKTWGKADNFGKALKGEGSYTVEPLVKP